MAPIFVQVMGALLIFRLFQPESASFALAVEIFLLGAVASWFLPESRRLWVMTATSIVGLFFVVDVVSGAAVLALGGALIAVSLLGISMRWKIAAFIATGALLLAWRHFAGDSKLAAVAVPVIGAIFMLRTVSYLREISRDPATASWKNALSFFFLLPNYVMWFFPLIDFKKFTAGAARERDLRVYRNGVDWIVDGVLQLLLYRLLQSAFYKPLESVNSFGDFFAYLFLNYLAYIRISGSFHVVIGAICLFGVELPKTHKLYFFSESCADVGRRLNIYWRDFMAKLIYAPLRGSLDRRGFRYGLAIAAAVVFGASCLMHRYIYVWTHDLFEIRLEDLLFWAGVGTWFSIDVYLENTRPKRELGFFAAFSRLWIRITFCLLGFSLIWAVWNCSSVGDLMAAFRLAFWRGPLDLLWFLIFPLVGLVGALHTLWHRSESARGRNAARNERWLRPRDIANIVFAGLAGFLILPSTASRLSERNAELVRGISDPNFLPEFEFKTRRHSYYEGLKSDDSKEVVDEDERPIETQPYFEPLKDYRRRKFAANVTTRFMGHEFRTNRWGMNSTRDYSIEKPPGVLRIAILAASNTVAYGVPAGSDWPSVSERLLNESGKSRVEILNFSVIGYSSFVLPYHYEREVLRFKPDIVLYAGGARELWMNGFNASTALRTGLVIPYQNELLPLLRVSSTESFWARHYVIDPAYETELALYKWGIHKIADLARANGAKLLFVMTPTLFEGSESSEGTFWDQKIMMNEARDAGFRVLDITGAVSGRALRDVTVLDDPKNYNHFSVLGHELLAREFVRQFEAP